MDGWMERECVWSLFSLRVCKSLQLAARTGLCLSLFVSPHLSVHLSIPSSLVWVYNNGVKHLRLPGNYGWAKTAGSATPTSSGTPQLAPHLHLPSLRRSPDDQRIIPLKRPGRREESGEGKKTDEWSQRDTSGGRWGQSHHQNCLHILVLSFFGLVFCNNFTQINLYFATLQLLLSSWMSVNTSPLAHGSHVLGSWQQHKQPQSCLDSHGEVPCTETPYSLLLIRGVRWVRLLQQCYLDQWSTLFRRGHRSSHAV